MSLQAVCFLLLFLFFFFSFFFFACDKYIKLTCIKINPHRTWNNMFNLRRTFLSNESKKGGKEKQFLHEQVRLVSLL